MIQPLSVPLEQLENKLHQSIHNGWRLGIFTARRLDDDAPITLITLMIDPINGTSELWETELPPGTQAIKSMTIRNPQIHRFERRLSDMFGIKFEGHPRPKSDVLHEAWPEGFHPLTDASSTPDDFDEAKPKRYDFLKVSGEEVYEIPVGPIHAGIIEPGHFRFSCLGEVIQNLEIRLGYQHRGIEREFTDIDWRKGRFLTEAISSDTAVGNACAHALAIEDLFDIAAPTKAKELRAIALEIERIASHIGDLGGICADIGYSGGNAVFSRLRGQALGLGEMLTGMRFMTSFILPGGVKQCPNTLLRDSMLRETGSLDKKFNESHLLLLDNPGALMRMENIGRVRLSQARDFGLVGPAGRASGIDYDVRMAFTQEPYNKLAWKPAKGGNGDVLSRVKVRIDEVSESLNIIRELLTNLDSKDNTLKTDLPEALPENQFGVGIVESWRGELIHLIYTDNAGRISRYAIKDPSFNNWTGLALAVRGQLVADFPLCNKSHNLSYSGNDL